MQISDIFKLNIEKIAEADNSVEILRPENSIGSLLDLIDKALDDNETYYLMSIVYLNNSNRLEALISFSKVNDVLNKISDVLSRGKSISDSVKELDLKSIAPIDQKIVVSINDGLDKVARIFKEGRTDVVVITNPDGAYFGKLTRNAFVKKIKDLLGSA